MIQYFEQENHLPGWKRSTSSLLSGAHLLILLMGPLGVHWPLGSRTGTESFLFPNDFQEHCHGTTGPNGHLRILGPGMIWDAYQ